MIVIPLVPRRRRRNIPSGERQSTRSRPVNYSNLCVIAARRRDRGSHEVESLNVAAGEFSRVREEISAAAVADAAFFVIADSQRTSANRL